MKKYHFLAASFASLAFAGPALAAGLSSTDKSFMKSAAEAGAMEIQGSQLAVSKSSNADVKTFANKMITDHTTVGNELSGIASAKGVTLPTDPSVVQRGKLKALGTLNGDHFDVNYANQVGVDAHQSTIKLFQKEAAKGSDPDVVAFANKTLPQLQGHLQMAQSLQGSLKK
jgi:putative membrane protein